MTFVRTVDLNAVALDPNLERGLTVGVIVRRAARAEAHDRAIDVDVVVTRVQRHATVCPDRAAVVIAPRHDERHDQFNAEVPESHDLRMQFGLRRGHAHHDVALRRPAAHVLMADRALRAVRVPGPVPVRVRLAESLVRPRRCAELGERPLEFAHIRRLGIERARHFRALSAARGCARKAGRAAGDGS